MQSLSLALVNAAPLAPEVVPANDTRGSSSSSSSDRGGDGGDGGSGGDDGAQKEDELHSSALGLYIIRVWVARVLFPFASVECACVGGCVHPLLTHVNALIQSSPCFMALHLSSLSPAAHLSSPIPPPPLAVRVQVPAERMGEFFRCVQGFIPEKPTAVTQSTGDGKEEEKGEEKEKGKEKEKEESSSETAAAEGKQ